MSSPARGGAVQLASSAVMALLQLAQIGTLARRFSDATLGVAALYLMVTGIVTVFCDFGLQSYVIQDRRPVADTIADVATILPGFVLVALAVCGAAAALAAMAGNGGELCHALLFAMAAVPLAIFSGPLQGLTVRELRIERLALAEAAGKGAGVAVTIGLALAGVGALSVMIGFYASLVLKLVCLRSDLARFVVLMRTGRRTGGALQAVAAYASAQLLGQIINALAAKADEMIVAATLPLATFGIYAALKQLVVQAVGFVSPVVRRLTMPRFSAHRRDDGTGPCVAWLVAGSNAIYIGFFLTLALDAELITRLLYGARFADYAHWLAWLALVWSLRCFANGTISALLQSTGAPYTDLFWTAWQASVQTVALLLAARHGVVPMLACVAVVHAALGVVGHLLLIGRRIDLVRRAISLRLLLPVAAYYAVALALRAAERSLAQPWLQPLAAAMLWAAIAGMTVAAHRRRGFVHKAIS